MDISKFKNLELVHLPGILSGELSLSEREVNILQYGQSTEKLPRVLVILDNYDKICKNDSTQSDSKSFWSEIAFMKNCNHMKMIITHQKEISSNISGSDLLFETTHQQVHSIKSDFTLSF